MHAPDGHLREDAINRVEITDAASFTVLLLRCNDWVRPVRLAALSRVETELRKMDDTGLTPLCLFVLNRGMNWGRGGKLAVDAVMAHPDWTVAMNRMFKSTFNGPLAKTLRCKCQITIRAVRGDIHLVLRSCKLGR